MKQKLLNSLRLRACMLVAVLCAGVSAAWGEDFTLSSAEEVTQNGVTVSFNKGEGSNAPTWYSAGLRLYAKNTITISSTKTIQSITFNWEKQGSKEFASVTANTGNYSHPTTTGSGTWSGTATSVTFTLGSSGQLQLNTLSVIVEGETPIPTCATPTFSPAEGTYESAQDVSISTTTEGATIYYTTDGKTPTTESTKYNDPINISTTTTVKAIAVKEGNNNSAVATATYTINLPYSGDDYVRVSSLGYLTDGAKVIIAARYNSNVTDYYAMTASASGKPTGVSFSSITSNNGEILPESIVNSESTYYWIVKVTSDGYQFTNAKDQVLGYNSSTNFAINSNTVWAITRATSGNSAMVAGYEGFYITTNNAGRGIALNNQHNYGPYATSNNNLSDYNFYVDIFVQGATPANDPSISASDVELEHNATSGSIAYTVDNEVTGGNLTASTNSDWLTLGNDFTSPIAFTCSANTSATSRTATVLLTYTYGDSQTVTEEVTVTQAAAPVTYTTIPAIFAAATDAGSTETNVNVTFGDWVVSGVGGSNVYVTDNNGNGFIIYKNDHGFTVNDKLSGTVAETPLKLYGGAAEFTGLTVSSTGLEVTKDGTVTVLADKTIAELGGVNTGAVIALSNLTYDGTNLSDGTHTIKPYNTLYTGTFESGKKYNVTGVYLQYNNTKEILPRSADDVEEVVNNDPVISVEATLSLAYDATSGEISYTVDNPRQGVILSADTDADWISNFVVTDDKVTFTTTVNEGSADRTATITLSYTGAEDKTVTVTQGHYMAPGEWVLTNLADLTENDVFVIVGTYDVDGSSYAMSNNNGTSAPNAVAVTVVENTNTLSGEIAENLQWNIGVADNCYTFYPNGTTESWLYCTNTNNGVKVGTNENNKTFTVSEEGYLVNAATSRYVGIYDSQDWRCYTSINSNIEGQTFSFYKKVENTPQTVEVTIAKAATDGSVNYGTLYYDNMNLSVPEGVKAYTASVSNGKITLLEVQGAIPARTGVLLKTESKLTDNTTFNFTEAAEAGTVSDGNMLHGTVDELGKAYAGEGNWKYYKLTTKNGSNLGFYFGVDGGAPFANGANKAYLAVPADQAPAKGFVLGEETDGINAIDNSQQAVESIYNLSGQRVQKATKGVYIVNGKKVVIR